MVEARKWSLNERVFKSAFAGSVTLEMELGRASGLPWGISLKIFVENPDILSRK